MTNQNPPPKPPWWAALFALLSAIGAAVAVLDGVTSLWQKFPRHIPVVVGIIIVAAAVGAFFKTRHLGDQTTRIFLMIMGCSGVVILIVGLAVRPTGDASTPPGPVTVATTDATTTRLPTTAVTPPDNGQPPQWVGCLSDGRPIACDIDHDAEVVELNSCTVPAVVDYMGGVAGVDQLSDTVRIDSMVDGSCVVRFAEPVRDEMENALASAKSARFRQCFDRNYRSVTCDRVHVAELTQRVTLTESLDCHSAASRYLSVEATTHERDLAWPEITGPAGARLCALSVRNPAATCLTGSLRHLGHTGVPFSRSC